ncbi:hypothetical protein GCM10010149_59980 [Nonomuraea roseoviolacea subsp. roseoviolacea]|uniref:hypothetical protein n=1 Tax=Nonomuraea roseoviolacea TaxID=103837 RepID=UPI0020A5756D|nr:hypothetical protein [Nonomuraea roseoviolacea]
MLVRRKHALRRAKDEDDPTSAGARRYEALGRVMAALATEADFIESCRDLTWWRGSDESWHLEWRDGPFASEAAALLAERLAAPGAVTAAGPGGAASAVLDVMGVRFELHAIDPMGADRVRARPGFWRLAEALDTTRRTNARHPWEELLGG